MKPVSIHETGFFFVSNLKSQSVTSSWGGNLGERKHVGYKYLAI
jgi:hypothetical protein